MWVYGSGFPKSHDVSKAIDRAAGAEREVVGSKLGQPGYSLTNGKGGLYGSGFGANGTGEGECQVTAPATPDAERWAGWGTSLKPAFEPVIWARKPLHNLGDCAIIIQNLTQMEAELCEHIANIAARSLQPTPHGSNGAKADFAQTPVVTQAEAVTANGMATGAAGVTNLEAAISGSTLEAVHIALNTISLWRSILEDALSLVSTSTTEMASSLTTDLKTWSLSLSQITLDSIILAASNPSGLTVPVSGAVLYSSVISAKLSAIQGLTAQGLVSREKQLTPDFEPVIVARKPFPGTVAANVLAWGTGAINVDGCRIETNGDEVNARAHKEALNNGAGYDGGWRQENRQWSGTSGRWPANLVHDGSDEVLALFPVTGSGGASTSPNGKFKNVYEVGSDYKGLPGKGRVTEPGSAARFFPAFAHDAEDIEAARFMYCAKASRADRDDGLEGMEARVKLRDDLTPEQREYVMAELKRHGVKL
jgi:hypothetical protein